MERGAELLGLRGELLLPPHLLGDVLSRAAGGHDVDFLRRRQAREVAHDLKLPPRLDAAAPVELHRVLRLDPRGAARQSALLLHGQLDEVGGGDRRGGDGGGRRPGEESGRERQHSTQHGTAPAGGTLHHAGLSSVRQPRDCPPVTRAHFEISHHSPTRTHLSPSRGSESRALRPSWVKDVLRAVAFTPARNTLVRGPWPARPRGRVRSGAGRGPGPLDPRGSPLRRECYTREPERRRWGVGRRRPSVSPGGRRLTFRDGGQRTLTCDPILAHGISPCVPRRRSTSS